MTIQLSGNTRQNCYHLSSECFLFRMSADNYNQNQFNIVKFNDDAYAHGVDSVSTDFYTFLTEFRPQAWNTSKTKKTSTNGILQSFSYMTFSVDDSFKRRYNHGVDLKLRLFDSFEILNASEYYVMTLRPCARREKEWPSKRKGERER